MATDLPIAVANVCGVVKLVGCVCAWSLNVLRLPGPVVAAAASCQASAYAVKKKKIGCEPCLTLRASASSACWASPADGTGGV